MKCIFFMAWVGVCGRESGDSEICPDHSGKKCWCGKQGVKQCSIAVSLVCGAESCKDHDCHIHDTKSKMEYDKSRIGDKE